MPNVITHREIVAEAMKRPEYRKARNLLKPWADQVVELANRCDALERSNAERKDKLDAASGVMSAQAATIAALREALHKIAYEAIGNPEVSYPEAYADIVEIARAALARLEE